MGISSENEWLNSDCGLAYLAGFFDGEGCIYVGINGGVSCRIVNTGLPVLECFKLVFGGSILNRTQKINKNQFVWSVYGRESEVFMEQMLRFSIEKLPQLGEALEWVNTRVDLQAANQGYCKGKKAHPDRENVLKKCRYRLATLKKEGFDEV